MNGNSCTASDEWPMSLSISISSWLLRAQHTQAASAIRLIIGSDKNQLGHN